MTQRPSGTTGPTAALARLIEDLGWLLRIAERLPRPGEHRGSRVPPSATEIEAAAAHRVARRLAARLEERRTGPAHSSWPG